MISRWAQATKDTEIGRVAGHIDILQEGGGGGGFESITFSDYFDQFQYVFILGHARIYPFAQPL